MNCHGALWLNCNGNEVYGLAERHCNSIEMHYGLIAIHNSLVYGLI